MAATFEHNRFAADESTARSLSVHDRAELDSRAILRQVQDATGYWTAESPAQLAGLGFNKRQSRRVPALVEPILGVDGEIVGHEIKPLHPQPGPDGKLRKRELVPGWRGRLHVSPLTRKHLADPHIPLIITESIFKADAAAHWPDAEVCAVGMIGSTGFRGINDKGGSTFLADFENVALKGKTAAGEPLSREVWIALDSNVTTNTQVLASGRRLAAKLRSRGADVHIVALPQPTEPGVKSTGVDDWRADNPAATFADLKALELKEDINSDALDYAIVKSKIEERYCIIENGWPIFDRKTGQTVTPYTFLHVAAAHFTYSDANGNSRSAAERWLKDASRHTYERLVLDPGTTPAGCLNLFTGFAVDRAAEGDTRWWVEHLSRLIPDAAIRHEVECILAWGFAHPERWKVHKGVVLIGAHGTGKDQTGEAVCRIIGDRHVARITSEHINSAYDGWLKDALFVKVEESSTDRSVANKMKKWVTSPTHIINPKCDRQLEIPNRTNFFITSNDVMPIYVGSDTERRWLVVKSPAEPMPREMADGLAEKLSDRVALSALLYRFKHQVNFDGFSPHAAAMKTDAFYELANDTSLSDLDRWVQRLIDCPDEALGSSEIWQARELACCLPDELKRRGGYETALTRSMGSLRFGEHIRRLGLISVAGAKLNLWAVRRGPYWQQQGSAAVAAEYIRTHPTIVRKPKY